MARTDWKDEAKTLKRKVKKLKAKLVDKVSDVAEELREDLQEAAEKVAEVIKPAKLVSPLAPPNFPQLPVIKGVDFAAVEAGIKYKNRKDVMLIRLAPGTSMAGVFTRSSTRSGCVRDCQTKLAIRVPAGAGAAIVVNSGNSNAFTGKVGDEAVAAVTAGVAASLNLPASRVFSSSTGVIGEPLDASKIVNVLPELVENLREDAIEMAAHAMMTTDTFPKGAAATIQGEGGPIHIAGIAKGSGMIAPDMATMLVYIFTDAKISPTNLQKMLSRNTDSTFNSITVDSDTSTSDTLLLAATGQSAAAEVKGATAKAFETALKAVMHDLALQVVRDGEGATKQVEIRLTGAANDADAAKAAFAIANSPLVKTAIAGEDPNWGRIVMAIGKSGAAAERDSITIHFGDVLVAKNGWRNPKYLEEEGAAHFKGQEILIRVDLGMGKSNRTVWTCDLTNRYIEINADYRS